MPSVWGQVKVKTPKATRSPTTRDLEWAAGFLEGEGSFQFTKGTGSHRVSAPQVNREPLLRLQTLFGGTVHQKTTLTAAGNRLSVWATSGSRARGVMMTMLTLVSEVRRKQIITALWNPYYLESYPAYNPLVPLAHASAHTHPPAVFAPHEHVLEGKAK